MRAVFYAVLLFACVGFLVNCGGPDIVSGALGTYSGSVNGDIKGAPIQKAVGFEVTLKKVKNDVLGVSGQDFSFEIEVVDNEGNLSGTGEGITFTFNQSDKKVTFDYKKDDTDIKFAGKPKIE